MSDEGAGHQPIHPDTIFTEKCPLYTVFVALQDIVPEMGPTVFLPGTNTEDGHARIACDKKTKEEFFKGREFRQALLHKGDVVVMDSRSMHYGDANSQSRRVLMYFTLLNPQCTDTTSLPKGSLFSDIKLSMNDLMEGV